MNPGKGRIGFGSSLVGVGRREEMVTEVVAEWERWSELREGEKEEEEE